MFFYMLRCILFTGKHPLVFVYVNLQIVNLFAWLIKGTQSFALLRLQAQNLCITLTNRRFVRPSVNGGCIISDDRSGLCPDASCFTRSISLKAEASPFRGIDRVSPDASSLMIDQGFTRCIISDDRSGLRPDASFFCAKGARSIKCKCKCKCKSTICK